MYIRFIQIILLVFLSGSALGEKYKITGEVYGYNTSEIFLLTQDESRVDTLAKCAIEQGKFSMEGEIGNACIAVLLIPERKMPQVILLDSDREFRVLWPESGQAIITGGKLQQTFNEYRKMVEKGNEKLKEMNAEVKKAVAAMHMKTAGEWKEKMETEKAEMQKRLQKLIDKNRGTLFAAYIMTSGIEQMDEEDLKACYARLNEKERTLQPGRRVLALLKKLEEVNIGAVAPDFTLNTPDNRSVSLYNVKGKLKIIDFWASWCGPCRLENPNMVALYNDFKDKGLAIVSVSLDNNKEAWMAAIEKDGLAWLHLSSLEGWESPVVKQYGVDAVPAIFVLDENNRIIARQIRGEKLRALVEERLK